ncbi:MAG: tetratricopeptide repeat-containing sensor histidine kinase [bacterium]
MRYTKVTIFFFFLFTVCANNLLYAQTELNDVLNSIKNKSGIEQINTLKNLCWDYRSKDPQLAIAFGKNALNKIQEFDIGSSKSEILNFLGVIYGNLGNLDSAYYYYQAAMNVAKEIEDSTQIAYSLNNFGDYYIKSALYSAALEKIFEAYRIFESIGDNRGMAYSLNDIGEVYIAQKNYDKALDYFKRSGELRLVRKDKRGYAKSLINIASVYTYKYEFKDALKTYELAEYYCEISDYTKGKSWIKAGISDIYFSMGNYNKALENSYAALDTDLIIGNKYGEIISYNKIGFIYFKLNKYEEAKKYLFKARDEAKNTGHLDQLMISYEHLTQLAVIKNDFQLAYQYSVESESIRDSIYSHKDLNKIADLQTAFFVEKKNRENEFLKKDIDHQRTTRNYLFIITLLIFAAIILVVSKYQAAKKANFMLNELNNSKDKLFSLIAHDLNNPVGAVTSISDFLRTDYDEIDEEEKKTLINSIADASKDIQNMLNNLLNWARTQHDGIKVNKISLNISLLLNSIALSYKFLAKKKDITIEIVADDNLFVNGDKFILETIIGNLLTNAIKFSDNTTKIIVSVKKEKNNVLITVKDFGRGMDNNTIERILKTETSFTTEGTNREKGIGLGLQICKEFAILHNAELLIESKLSKGSSFTLKI